MVPHSPEPQPLRPQEPASTPGESSRTGSRSSPAVVLGAGSRARRPTLVQISDVHVGPRVNDDYVVSVFAVAAPGRHRGADGDLVSYHERVFEQMERIIATSRGRMATLGIQGPRLRPAWSHPEIADRVVAIAQQCGIVMPRNQACEVEGLQIVGLDDLGRHISRRWRFAGYDDRPAIALSHNPTRSSVGAIRGSILSGHTHGGSASSCSCRRSFRFATGAIRRASSA